MTSVDPAPVRPTPHTAPAWRLLPACWLVGALLVIGAARVGMIGYAAFTSYPVATTVATGLFALYAVPFWIFVNALDYLEREPPVLLAVAFGWGALVATSTAIPGSVAAQNLLAKLVSPGFAADWGPAVAGATVEEILKVLGIVAIVLVARAQVNSILDGVVYGALVGLGFQVVEDVLYAVQAVALAGDDRVGPVVTTFFQRGFLAGLWSHTLFGALAGAGVGYAAVRTDRSPGWRAGAAGLALGGAWLCHFVWNAPPLGGGLAGPAALVLLLVKGVPPLVMILLLVRAARRREADYYAAHLAALDDPRVVTPGELRVLGLGLLRAEARRSAVRHHGWRAYRAVRRLQRAQARLAVELSRSRTGHAGAGPAVLRWRAEALSHRRRLVALGHLEAVPLPRGDRSRWAWLHGLALVAAAAVVIWLAARAFGG